MSTGLHIFCVHPPFNESGYMGLELLVDYEIGHVAANLKQAVEMLSRILQVSSKLADF